MRGQTRPGPTICVWEITLACNSRCVHCGSSAGRARPDELSTSEALALIRDLAVLGCRSMTLSGGEPLLRADWTELAAAIRGADMRLEMISNGLLVADQIEAIADAGFFAVTLSVDGLADVHDRLRGTPSALTGLLAGAAALKRAGVRLGACTQVNQLNLGQLDRIHELLVEHGFDGWQIQLTMPLGRAAEPGANCCLAPEDLLQLEAAVLALKASSPLPLQVADNVGYMSRSEPRLRTLSGPQRQCWLGCPAGLDVVGVTSNGTIRGCLSLPAAFDEGNIRQRSVAAIWREGAFAYNRAFHVDQLEGACRGCAFGRVCRAGCTCLAFAATGSTVSNPYCLYRLTNRRAGDQ